MLLPRSSFSLAAARALADAAAASALRVGSAVREAELAKRPSRRRPAIKLTLAIDNRDTGEILDLVDIPRVASRTLDELAQGNTRTADGLDLAGMALELMAGARVRTVFDDPEHRVRITPGEFLDAWWGMEREGPEARMTLDAAGQPIELLLSEGPDLRWRIVGITPLAALLRVTPR